MGVREGCRRLGLRCELSGWRGPMVVAVSCGLGTALDSRDM